MAESPVLKQRNNRDTEKRIYSMSLTRVTLKGMLG